MVRVRLQTLGQALGLTAGVALLALATPALADVKAGVDAWARGDYATAVREWVGPAEQGDPDAQFNLAQAYRLGRGVDADQAQAEALYARAAEQGHLKAADNYGLILFQKGEREKSLPYLQGAASRGDPRAQYLLGVAHFNGDLVVKDWRRAYALTTLANSSGLPQARGALTQMDEYIPLADRQAAQVLASQIKAQAEAARASELAAVDLALVSETAAPRELPTSSAPVVTPTVGNPERSGDRAAVIVARANPQPVVGHTAALPQTSTAAVETPTPPVARVAKGSWSVQLGAFGVPGNADRMWDKIAGRPEVAGRQKVKEPAGRLTKLLAGGYASRAEATAACSALKRGGFDCLVTQ